MGDAGHGPVQGIAPPTGSSHKRAPRPAERRVAMQQKTSCNRPLWWTMAIHLTRFRGGNMLQALGRPPLDYPLLSQK